MRFRVNDAMSKVMVFEGKHAEAINFAAPCSVEAECN